MKKLTAFFLILFLWSSYITDVYALKFQLIAPSGLLQRGQEVTFTIRIDPEGETLNNAIIGLAYDTQYLEFLNAIPGDTFTSISTEEIEFGRLVLTGAGSNPVSSEGVFARVNFRLIADAPGATQLCSFFNPEITPTPTTQPTTPQPTPTPQPTTLPAAGTGEIGNIAFLAGGAGIISGASIFALRRLLSP